MQRMITKASTGKDASLPDRKYYAASIAATRGYVFRPSCIFRWDLYPFNGAFDHITSTLPPASPPAALKTNTTTINQKGKFFNCVSCLSLIFYA